jgi:hypothetical protein
MAAVRLVEAMAYCSARDRVLRLAVAQTDRRLGEVNPSAVIEPAAVAPGFAGLIVPKDSCFRGPPFLLAVS